MQWIVMSMKWIMLVSGALTCTMLYAAIAPQAALQGTFGETLDGPVANIVVRNGRTDRVDGRDADLRRVQPGGPIARVDRRGHQQGRVHRARF